MPDRQTKGSAILALLRRQDPERYDDGHEVRRMMLPSERYVIDFDPALRGWQQYDTDQDAHYFGVWVDVSAREVLTYAEGDWTLSTHPTAESFREKLRSMESFYGPPPPAMVSIDQDGQRTEYYDPRPSADAEGGDRG